MMTAATVIAEIDRLTKKVTDLQKHVDELMNLLDLYRASIQLLDGKLSSITAERDSWRAQAEARR